MKINEFINVEGNFVTTALVRSISEKEDRNGNPYIMVEISDGESIITARMFNASEETCGFAVADVLKMTISSRLYNGTMSFVINYYEKMDEDEYNIQDYIVSAPEKFSDMISSVKSYIDKIQNSEIKTLVQHIYDDNFEKLSFWSAARAMHHNYYGGLLYHSLCVTKNAYAIAQNYDLVNRDLVIAGALLHDIGKTRELNTDNLGNASYSVDGELFGHLFIGAQIVKDKCEKIGVDEETTRQLLHIIVSHHDNLEWGAIKRPSTAEARIVACADMCDAQLEMIRQSNMKTEVGECSSSYVDGSKIYHAPQV